MNFESLSHISYLLPDKSVVKLRIFLNWRQPNQAEAMLQKTRGIVFKTTHYSESSVIVQVFTEKLGLQSYLINGVKKPKAKISLNMLQPLHLLDMVVYHKANSNIQRVAELRQLPVFQNIPYDIVKSSLAIFLNEVIYKSIKQESKDELLFDFLFHAIELLDRMEKGLANFHLYFLMRLTRFLGFFPETNGYSDSSYFDLKNAEFTQLLPPHSFVVNPPQIKLWYVLMESNFEELEHLQMLPADRKMLLESLLDYYRLHVDHFGEIKSQAVLAEIFS
jgi:DNA repair protein RecO (recombination protein O)